MRCGVFVCIAASCVLGSEGQAKLCQPRLRWALGLRAVGSGRFCATGVPIIDGRQRLQAPDRPGGESAYRAYPCLTVSPVVRPSSGDGRSRLRSSSTRPAPLLVLCEWNHLTASHPHAGREGPKLAAHLDCRGEKKETGARLRCIKTWTRRAWHRFAGPSALGNAPHLGLPQTLAACHVATAALLISPLLRHPVTPPDSDRGGPAAIDFLPRAGGDPDAARLTTWPGACSWLRPVCVKRALPGGNHCTGHRRTVWLGTTLTADNPIVSLAGMRMPYERCSSSCHADGTPGSPLTTDQAACGDPAILSAPARGASRAPGLIWDGLTLIRPLRQAMAGCDLPPGAAPNPSPVRRFFGGQGA